MTRCKAVLAREQRALAKRRQKIEAALAIAARKDAGTTVEKIARELGMSKLQIEARLRSAEWYREHLAKLAAEPTHIYALKVLGKIPDIGWVYSELEDYGVTTLRQLAEQEWSRAEIAATSRFKVPEIHLDRIEAAMAQFGLKLHTDREQPIERELTEEKQLHRDGIDPKDDWAKVKDREFIIEQARRVADETRILYQTLRTRWDDPRYYAKAARFLQKAPDGINAMIAERDRLLGATRKTWELERAVKARAAASRRVAEIAVAMAGSGNVVQFPTTLH
jgi:hypothetical protein